ncbi:MAG: BspA family leucine-rich repeat surface protein [Oscillospiraceae bacterium]|nr:BspA family leucine-rich repeat surface protein [Oscillospiraceae bacterium]
MKSKFAMRAAAGLLTLALAAGAVPSLPKAVSLPVLSAVTAQAAGFYMEINSGTGTLTLEGELPEPMQFRNSLQMVDWSEVSALEVGPGTVFPENCAGMFSGMNELVSVDLTGADFSGTKDITALFSGCSRLRDVKLTGLDFSSVTKVSSCFAVCTELESVDLTGSSFSACESFASMFANCYRLKSVKGLSADSPALNSLSGMFYNCVALSSIDLSAFHTDTAVSFDKMFQNCCGLTELDLSGFRTANAESLAGMFYYCVSLRSLDLQSFETSDVTDMSAMFEGCRSLKTLGISSFDTRKVSDLNRMFYGCARLSGLDLSGFVFDTNVSAAYLFQGCEDLTELNISGFDSGKLTSAAFMFKGLTHLEKLTLGEKFTGVSSEMSLPNPDFGWVNEADPETVVSGESDTAIFDNNGLNTYVSGGGYGRITGTKLLMPEDGSVGLRFYAELSDKMDPEDRELGDLWFFIYGTDESASNHYRAQKDADGKYYVSVKVPAKNMADRIEAELRFWSRRVIGLEEGEEPATGDVWSKQLDEVCYSVRDYADVILSAPDRYAAEQDAIKAMLSYGGAAQRHFGNYDPTMPYMKPCADLGIVYTAPALETVNSFVRPAPLSGLAYYAVSVVLDSETVQRHYFRLKDGEIGDYVFTVDGEEVTPTAYPDTTLYYIDTKGIPAMKLYDSLEISAALRSDPAQNITYKYSALDYVRLGAEKGRLTGTAADAAKALGHLALAVRNYMNNG